MVHNVSEKDWTRAPKRSKCKNIQRLVQFHFLSPNADPYSVGQEVFLRVDERPDNASEPEEYDVKI